METYRDEPLTEDPAGRFISEQPAGDASCAKCGDRGFLSKIFVSEPSPGDFGSTRGEFSERVISTISDIIDAQSSGFAISSQGPRPIEEAAGPAVRSALDTGQGIFLIGTTDEGTRRVAFLVLR